MGIQKLFGVPFRTGAILLLIGALNGCAGKAEKSAKAEELYLNAVSHYAKRSLDEAAAELRSALAEDAHFFQAELLLGKVLFFQDQEEAALVIFETLHKKLPQYTEARLWHIRCLILTGQYEDAQKLLDEETAFNPGDWRVYYHCAQIASFTGDTEKHIAELKSAAAFLEDGGRVYVDLAKVWYALGLEDRARTYVERSVALAGTESPFAESINSLQNVLQGILEKGGAT
jgi:tetratricopeptide (TPR) repeat protein